MNIKLNSVFRDSAIILIIALIIEDVLFKGISDLLLGNNSLLNTEQALLVTDAFQFWTRIVVLLIVLYKASELIRNKLLINNSSINNPKSSGKQVLKKFILLGYLPYLVIATAVLIVYPPMLIRTFLNEAILATITITCLYQIVTGSRIGVRTIAIYACVAVGLAVGNYLLFKLFWMVAAWAGENVANYTISANIVFWASKVYRLLNLLWSAISIVVKLKVLSRLLPIMSDDDATRKQLDLTQNAFNY